MFWDDHNPPHFHAFYAGEEALVVGTLRCIRTGAIVAIDGDARAAATGKHQRRGNFLHQAVDRETEIALDAVAQLAPTSCSTTGGHLYS